MSMISLKMPDENTDTFARGFKCPSCGGSSVFLAKGNYLTCGYIECPNPDVGEVVANLVQQEGSK